MADGRRPPFILALASDMQGCGYHRMAVPLVSLCQAGLAEGRIDLSPWSADMVRAVRPDVVVVQRYVEDSQIDALKAMREAAPDALFVYELDDYLGEVPPASFHAGFMPPNLGDRIAKAAALCDRATVSTEPMAMWFRDELGVADVRVVGNAIPEAVIRPREARPAGQRLRVGFIGGISHDGDLELIRPAMADIGNEVEWVFFGTQPKNAPVRVEFHPGVQPTEYQARMLNLDLDLVLAPLETNRFNICKSNLRLIEAGMIGACVIAQRLEPYTAGDPPVFDYADDADSWTRAIRTFMGASPDARQHIADKLQAWVKRRHTLERRLSQRAEAWLQHSKGASRFAPSSPATRTDDVVIVVPPEAAAPTWSLYMPRKKSLLEACERAASTGSDVLWMRPGTSMDSGSWDALRAAISQAQGIAAAVPLASDGANAFPRADHWTQLGPELVSAMAGVLRRRMSRRRLMVTTPSGPVVLLSAAALASIGFPDVEGCGGNEEQAILEWGLRAAMKGMRSMQAADAFASSANTPAMPPQPVLQRLHLRGYSQVFQQQGVGETLTPKERVELEMDLLRLQWTGPQPGTMGFGHDYKSWSALRGDLSVPHPARRVLVESAYGGEGWPDAEWVVFTEDGFEWKTNGFAVLNEACAGAPEEVKVVYADHELRNAAGDVYPDMKPDFDLELWLARDYITPVCAVRTSVLPVLAHMPPRDKYALFEMLLNFAEGGKLPAAQRFAHLPKFVASLPEITEPELLAVDAISRQAAIEALYGSRVAVRAHPALPGALSVVYNWDADSVTGKRTYGNEHRPLVSIIIPTLGSGRLIQPCVNTIRQHTAYPNFEIVVMQNGPREKPELGSAAENDPRVRVMRWDPPKGGKFSWSAICNEAVRKHAEGRFICFMNDDVATGSPDWLDAMVGQAMQVDVGAVGARLVHPAGVVQHVGVICHKGVAGHLFKGLPNGNPGNGWLAALTHEASAVTGACMLVSRANFEQVGGFDEETFPMNYSDTDFCMKLRAHGLRNIVEMSAELLHPEGTSRTDMSDQEGIVRQLRIDNANFAQRWPDADPYWHPDLALGIGQGGLTISGLNRDMLVWTPKPVRPGAKRVLLVNDLPGMDGLAIEYARQGDIVFGADMGGLNLRLVAPIPANVVGGWDVRNPEALAADLAALGIDRIVLRSLVGNSGAATPVEALRCLGKLGIPVEMRPVSAELLAPWTALAENETGPVLSLFGAVDMKAWRSAYEALLPQEREVAD